MRGTFKIGTWRGVALNVHWTFFLVIAWIMINIAATKPGAGTMGMSLLFLIMVFACITLHEFGHVLIAARFGIKTKSIILLPIGGVASIEKFTENPVRELAISIAGPLVNFLIAAVIWIFSPEKPSGSIITGAPGIATLNGFFYDLMLVNLVLAIFNLIPAFPMDGGRVLRALLALRINYIRATTIAAVIGKAISSLFIFWGIISFDPFIALIGVFLILAASTEEYYLKVKSLIKGVILRDVMMYDYDSLNARSTVQEAARIIDSNHQKYFVLMENEQPLGTLHRIEIIKAAAEMRYNELLKNLKMNRPVCLEASELAENVLDELLKNREQIYPVTDNGRCKGVVSLAHIIEHQLIHNTRPTKYPESGSLSGLLR